jgi:hypothetical protein
LKNRVFDGGEHLWLPSAFMPDSLRYSNQAVALRHVSTP